ncbi:MAG: polyprenyl synthetase family protein [Chitinophagaceae bacterium]|nr:polyprenyl synthetase family protein [Chitinophagaceae bacterium]
MKEIDFYSAYLNKEIEKLRFGSNPIELYQPIEYIMGLGGKRIRPILVFVAYTLFQKNFQNILKAALSVELFHNFTLMHDDIMDNAPIRRNMPTVHKKWNTNRSIISGDAMMIKTYDYLLTVPKKKLYTVLQVFNTCATQVCEGQQLDINFETQSEVTEEEYIAMIQLKTAVLIGYSLELGAILGGANADIRNSLSVFGEKLGIGFQLKDDLLDIYAENAKFGKQIGGDIITNKKTFLYIKALELSSPADKEILIQYFSTPTQAGDAEQKIQAVKHIYNTVNIYNITQQKINSYFEMALAVLDKMPLPDEKKILLQNLSSYLIERER